MSVPTPRFFVYVLARPDGSPFYVGKGSAKRIKVHEYEARRGHRCHKCSIIRKVWRSGGEIQRYIMLETADETEAYEHERTLIALFGRDTLANYTDGAEGSTGRVYSDAERRQRSINSKCMWQRPTYRALRNASLRAAYSRAELRSQKSEQTRQTWTDTTIRERRTDGLKAIWQDPEYRARMVALRKATGESPEFRAKCSEAMIAYLATPEGKEQRSGTMRQLWQDPEYRAKQSAARKEVWARRKVKQNT